MIVPAGAFSNVTLYDSKFIQTLIFFIFGFMVIVFCLFIAYYTKDRWILLKGYINSITIGLNMNTVLFVMGMLSVIFLEIFNAIQCGFLGIIMGYKKNNNKIGYAVIYGFINYLLSQGMVLLLVFIVGLFNKNIMDLFKSNVVFTASSFKLLVFLAIGLYLLIIGLMSIICKKEFNKGVNIE